MERLSQARAAPSPPKERDVGESIFLVSTHIKEAPSAKDFGGWAWSRRGTWDSHIPECFPKIRFTTNEVSTVN